MNLHQQPKSNSTYTFPIFFYAINMPSFHAAYTSHGFLKLEATRVKHNYSGL